MFTEAGPTAQSSPSVTLAWAEEHVKHTATSPASRLDIAVRSTRETESMKYVIFSSLCVVMER